MRRRTILGVTALAAVLVAGLGVALLVLRADGVAEAPEVSSPRRIEARASIAPLTPLFGDTVTARVDVTLDRRAIDPDSVHVEGEFVPWEVVGGPTLERRDSGEITLLGTTFVLRCLTSPCLPVGRASPIELDPARVTFERRDGDGVTQESLAVRWPVLLSYSRFASATVQSGETLGTVWRADLRTLPAATYRLPPGVLIALLLLVAGLLGVLSARLAYLVWPRRTPPPPPEPEPEPIQELTPLEQALVLLEDAGHVDGEADRRRALELVAEELEERASQLAATARALAWSEDAPRVAETSRFAGSVRSVLEQSDAGEDDGLA